MTDERRKHQCHAPGCDSAAAFEARVKLVVTGGNGVILPLNCHSSMRVCDAHRAHAAAWLLSDKRKDEIVKGLAAYNIPAPDFARAEVILDRIERPACVLEINAPPPPPPPQRIAACDRDGCILPAKWQLALRVWQFGESKRKVKPARLLLNLCVCARHSKDTTAAALLGRSERSKIVATLAQRGLPMPDLRQTEVELVPLIEGKRADPAAFARGEIRAATSAVT